jgi:hypothetical protein
MSKKIKAEAFFVGSDGLTLVDYDQKVHARPNSTFLGWFSEDEKQLILFVSLWTPPIYLYSRLKPLITNPRDSRVADFFPKGSRLPEITGGISAGKTVSSWSSWGFRLVVPEIHRARIARALGLTYRKKRELTRS